MIEATPKLKPSKDTHEKKEIEEFDFFERIYRNAIEAESGKYLFIL